MMFSVLFFVLLIFYGYQRLNCHSQKLPCGNDLFDDETVNSLENIGEIRKFDDNTDGVERLLINRLTHITKMIQFSSSFGKDFNCNFEEHKGTVLIEISEGRAYPPDFDYLISSQCLDSSQCESFCNSVSCNYFISSKFDNLSHFYIVSEENRNSAYMVPSTGYNSFKKTCTSHNAGPTNFFVQEQTTNSRENCRWSKSEGQVLGDINQGRAMQPDYKYHFSMQCPNFNDCRRMCDLTACNYILRSKFDSLSHMYEISGNKIQNAEMDTSKGYDSYKKDCYDEPLFECHWKSLSGKVLTEISEGRAFKPDFVYQISAQCRNFLECQKICDAMLCNYIVRSKFDGLSHMYEISEEKLRSRRMDATVGYDSYKRECLKRNLTEVYINKQKNESSSSEPNCKWIKKERMVLKEISEGRTFAPDFTYHGSMECHNFDSCKEMCSNFSCNYIVRSIFNTLSHIYTVVQTKLYSEYIDHSLGYDSFVKICSSGYNGQGNATNCTDCKKNVGSNGYGIYNSYNSYNQTSPEPSPLVENLQSIDDLNSGRVDEEDAFFAPNKYSNFSHSNFIQTFTGLRTEDENDTMPAMNDTDTEEEFLGSNCTRFTWGELGVIPPVRDQGTCGSCYAFTSVDLAAAQYSIDRSLWNHHFVLSPQFIIDCLKPLGAFGCSGGRPVNVFNDLAKGNTVIPTSECYPYNNKVGQCVTPTCQIDPDEEEVTVKWARLVRLSGKMEMEKVAALLRWGPMITFIDASPSWQFYNGTGIIRARHCQRKSNHAVLLVGYNYEGKVPYYIIKNSWGVDYGDEGYVKLEAGTNACNVAANLVISCTSNCEKLKKLKNLIQRPHSTSCLEVTTTSNFNSTLLNF